MQINNDNVHCRIDCEEAAACESTWICRKRKLRASIAPILQSMNRFQLCRICFFLRAKTRFSIKTKCALKCRKKANHVAKIIDKIAAVSIEIISLQLEQLAFRLTRQLQNRNLALIRTMSLCNGAYTNMQICPKTVASNCKSATLVYCCRSR